MPKFIKIKGLNFKTSENNPWNERQIQTFCEELFHEAGGPLGWRYLGDLLRRALVSAKVQSVVFQSWREEIAVDAIRDLQKDMELLLEKNRFLEPIWLEEEAMGEAS